MDYARVPIRECPYWSPGCKQLCALTVGGLYMPLAEHIQNFCRSRWWDKCPQYIRGCDALLDLAWKRGLVMERGQRRYPRVATRQGLQLLPVPADGPPADADRQTAWTLDLGQGGMRIETPGNLPPGAQISFIFGEDFPLPGFSGQAEIRWQRQVNQEGICQYGLGFLDQKSGWAMRELLLCN
ncbi:PilZ domain-containing protein [Desulfurivibrio sp. D14AmB]|uniref:PilZ domain-containing protein n=1 Tax=Desulfurivibrio sp. D14AmB TaxID=3374370 RepID=UPI00376F0FDC